MKIHVHLPQLSTSFPFGRLVVLAAAPLLAVPLVASSIGCTEVKTTAPAPSAVANAPETIEGPDAIVAGPTTSGSVDANAPSTARGASDTLASDDGFEAPEVKPPTLFALEALPHQEKGHDFVAEGDALLEEGRVGEALVAFRHALYSEERGDVWQRLGDAYAKSGDDERAMQAWEASVGDADSPATRRQLVKLYLDQQHGEQARVHAEALVRQQPTAKSQYLLGRAYLQTAMWQEAIDAFEKTLEGRPSDIFAHNNLGFAALQIGENELALTHLEHVLDLSPIRPYMLNNLGVAYERTGRGPEALAAFTYAAEIDGGYVKATVNKERVLANLSVEEQTLSAEVLDEMKVGVETEDATAMIGPEQQDGE